VGEEEEEEEESRPFCGVVRSKKAYLIRNDNTSSAVKMFHVTRRA
jgi:hypothetical protein